MLAPGAVGNVSPKDLHFDPRTFQFKMNVDGNGVTNMLKGVKFNPVLAGVIQAWASDGKLFVVNGHHRAILALEDGAPELLTRHIIATDAAEARMIGALTNIAEGHGTELDAAKFFRDGGYTPEDLERFGISLGGKTAEHGMSLARLHPMLFERVVSGEIILWRGIAIGSSLEDPAKQEAVLRLIEKAERAGRSVGYETVFELSRMVAMTGVQIERTQNLFGFEEHIHSLALEKAEVSTFIRKCIIHEKRLFGFVSNEEKAIALERGGNHINARENKRISGEAEQALETYDRLSTRTAQSMTSWSMRPRQSLPGRPAQNQRHTN